MFESIKFENFKTLRNTTLPLSPFTLIVGPNGSGKSTALNAFTAFRNDGKFQTSQITSFGSPNQSPATLMARWKENDQESVVKVSWNVIGSKIYQNLHEQANRIHIALARATIYSLDAVRIAAPVVLSPDMEMSETGANLAGVLDRLRDKSPERFAALNKQLENWIPEFNQILFDTPGQGLRSIALRTRDGHHIISASNLSHGTLIALALLTMAYVPDPPSIICLEEPDRGLHPRLLRDVKDALYRLTYPDPLTEKRPPVQVIATTHNPYFLDLFREHPEEIVIAEKVGLESKFSRLSDRSDLNEILGDAPLSEVWYSGVLGGVPTGT